MLAWTLWVTLAVVLAHLHVAGAQKNEAEKPKTVLSTTGLPMHGGEHDFRQMPYVGNGFIATVVKSDAVYMRGIYNGRGAKSHRARIPSCIDISLSRLPLTTNYSLDVAKGVFTEVFTTEYVELTFQTFAHSKIPQLLVISILARRIAGRGSLTVHLKETSRNNTGDFDLIKAEPYEGQNEFMELRTKEKETDSSGLQTVYVYSSPVTAYTVITIDNGSEEKSVNFIMSLDTNRDRARNAFSEALSSEMYDPGKLMREHIEGWNRIWSLGYITVDNNELQSVIDSSLYYIMSSMRFNPDRKKDELVEFFGISSDSLSRGALGHDRQGHVYRDAELWIYPALLMLHSDTAESMLQHRFSQRKGAPTMASADGKQVYAFPSDSAFSGTDLASLNSAANKTRIQINGDIAFAVRQFFSSSWDTTWLITKGCDMAKGIAEYWNSRIQMDVTNYDINQVTDPNDESRTVDNSAYVNAAASSALKFAKLALCICNRPNEIDKEWTVKANRLELPFDVQKQVHLEHKNFVSASNMKELGAVMLGFPLMYNMSDDVRRKDLDHYSQLVGTNGPPTAYSMLAIGYNELLVDNKANEYFDKSYKAYLSEPFKVWSELPGKTGAVNFLPGAGAFLQALLYGYGGVRIRYDRLELNPQLPPRCSRMKLYHLDYLGAVIDVTVGTKDVSIRFHDTGGKQFVIYDVTGHPTVINEDGQTETLPFGNISIQSSTKIFDTCHIPIDKIELDGESARLSDASRHQFDFVRIVSSLLLTLMLLSAVVG